MAASKPAGSACACVCVIMRMRTSVGMASIVWLGLHTAD